MPIRKKDLIDGKVFSIKVDGLGFVLAQFRDDCRMEVFDNLKKTDSWDGTNLNKEKILFTIVVAKHRMLKLFSSDVSSCTIKNVRPRILMGLSYSTIREKTNTLGLSLIEHEQIYDPSTSKVIISMLDPEIHKDILYSYEFLGMHGDSEKIRERIIKYYTTGVNWDEQKSILYPELSPPSKGYKRISYSLN